MDIQRGILAQTNARNAHSVSAAELLLAKSTGQAYGLPWVSVRMSVGRRLGLARSSWGLARP